MKCPDCETKLRPQQFRCKCGWRAVDAVLHSTENGRARLQEEIASHNQQAAKFCADNGLTTREQMREFLRAKLPKHGESDLRGLNWAEKVMERIDRGERVSLAAEDAARAALGRPRRARQPGEDESEWEDAVRNADGT